MADLALEELDGLEEAFHEVENMTEGAGVDSILVLRETALELLRSARLALQAEEFLREQGFRLHGPPRAMKLLTDLMKELGIIA